MKHLSTSPYRPGTRPWWRPKRPEEPDVITPVQEQIMKQTEESGDNNNNQYTGQPYQWERGATRHPELGLKGLASALVPGAGSPEWFLWWW